MKDINIKELVVWLCFFALGLALLCMKIGDGWSFTVILACGFLVLPYFSKSTEELSIWNVFVVRRFKQHFDEREQERVNSQIDLKVAERVRFNEDAAKRQIASLVKRGLESRDSEILELRSRVAELEGRPVASQFRFEHPDLRMNPCPIHGTADLCRNSQGVYCNCCGDYVCNYQASLC